MTFTSLPEMFSSVFGPLAYTFSNAAETELFLEILSTRDGSRIGSKRFYNTPTGTLNIAPMVRKNIRFVPSSGMTGFCNSESRSASVQLAVGTTYSEVRTFVAAHDSVKPSRILTTMPSHRIIAYGESDEITCCIPGQHTVTVTSDITAEALTYNAIGGEELTLFRLNTRSFLPSVGTDQCAGAGGEIVSVQVHHTDQAMTDLAVGLLALDVDQGIGQRLEHAVGQILLHGVIDILNVLVHVGCLQIGFRQDQAQGGGRIAHFFLHCLPVLRLRGELVAGDDRPLVHVLALGQQDIRRIKTQLVKLLVHGLLLLYMYMVVYRLFYTDNTKLTLLLQSLFQFYSGNLKNFLCISSTSPGNATVSSSLKRMEVMYI